MQKNTYRCLISSPSDCAIERSICEKVIIEINRGIADLVNIQIEPKMWEYNVIPDMGGKEAQSIIDETFADSYELFIGIMYAKFGTPTKKAGSGTEQEFNNAFEKRKSGSIFPKILFYFNKSEVKLNSIAETHNYIKVQEFQDKLRPLGLYWEYNGVSVFEGELRNHLTLFIKEEAKKAGVESIIIQKEDIKNILKKRLSEALQAYSSDPNVWIEPILSDTNKISSNPSENYDRRIDINKIINNPTNYVIKAPPEFGLTCLSHYLSLEAWNQNKIWLYIDSKAVKPHTVIREIKKEITEIFKMNETEIDCILLDSWIIEKSGSLKIIKEIDKSFPNTPLIIMQTIDNPGFYQDQDKDITIDREFSILHLLAMPQNQIRTFVEGFNKVKLLDENENIVLKKVTLDFEALNLHRTAKNCLTILKAANKQGFEESPVNRTKFIEVVLSVIFEEYEIPNYKQKKPDQKDCEFVLGRFCEMLIRENNFEFTKKQFIDEVTNFCNEKLIQIDVFYLFEIFVTNHIFSNRNEIYFFKSSFWLFYFAGHRMFLDQKFCDYIFSDKKYISYPEIIEFYTGIDRNRENALTILLSEINETCNIVESKVGLSKNLNPYSSISWNPEPSELEKMKESISDDIISSKLPDIVKDRYDDTRYDQIRPYNQEIRTILEKYSLITLMNKIRACSKALRNSDYANTEIRRKMLDEIIRGWNQVSSVLIALAPILSDKGYATFEGASFVLNENDFPGDKEQRHFQILTAIPKNVVDYFKNELFSNKLTPLLVEKINKEKNPIGRHEIVLMIIRERPGGWRNIVEDYISNLNINSFFLSDLAISLQTQYRYNSSEYEERRIIEHLFKMCLAKHEFKDKKPGIDKINLISSEIIRIKEEKPE